MFLTPRADSLDRSPWGEFWFRPVPSVGGMVNVTADSALQLTAVFACVRVLSEGTASLPFTLARVGADGGKTRVTNHWLYRLFAQRPNRFQNPFEFREMLQGHLSLRGNAYCEIFGDSSGVVTDLVPLHPDRISIDILPGGDWRYQYKQRDGTTRVLSRQDVFHLRGLSSDGITGISPIAAAATAISLGMSAQDYGARFFANDATPGGGWIEYPGQFKDQSARDVFRQSWQHAQAGRNHGKTAVLEFGMKYHQLTVNNDEAQFIETRKMQISEIARLFRVPPHLIGDLDRSTNNNIEQQSLDFIMHTLTPWLNRWESAIRYTFLVDGPDEDLDIEFPVTALLRGDSTARSAYYMSGITNGWLTRNEARIAEGKNPLAGLDAPLLPLNMREEGEEPPQQAAPPMDPTKPSAPENDRAAMIAAAAAERIARKEVTFCLATIGDADKRAEAYRKHVAFVQNALFVSREGAETYCAEQQAFLAEHSDAESQDFEHIARARLERLALKGSL